MYIKARVFQIQCILWLFSYFAFAIKLWYWLREVDIYLQFFSNIDSHMHFIYFLFHLVIFFSVVLPALLFRLPGFDLPVFQRGFFCSDETISYPYKDSTVPSTVLYAVGIGLYLVIVSIECTVIDATLPRALFITRHMMDFVLKYPMQFGSDDGLFGKV